VSAFTPAEIEYLREGKTLARIATVGRDGQPHIIPVTFWFNADEDAIDVGGIAFGEGKKWRDAEHNRRVTFLLDDTPTPGRARALEVRGQAELHATGGEAINPRFPNFAPQFFRIRPRRIVSWGVDDSPTRGATGGSFRPNGRTVAP
jgi:pyridoxamine 5'-phosphate oxidase family protein